MLGFLLARAGVETVVGCKSRIEDAIARQRRARERFLGLPVAAAKPATGRALRQMLGRDEHRAIADEMARFL